MGYQIQFSSFFLKKTHIVWLKPEKPVLRTHFPPYLWFYWSYCFQKQESSPMSGPAPTMWISWKSDQNCDPYHNFLYIYISIYTYIHYTYIYIYIYIYIYTPPPEGVRIVVISFRNIAKKRVIITKKKVREGGGRIEEITFCVRH